MKEFILCVELNGMTYIVERGKTSNFDLNSVKGQKWFIAEIIKKNYK